MPRPAHPIATFVLAITLAVLASLLPAAPASAHNSLVSSDPADGATLTTAPSQITWEFANAVPLETLTVTLIDPTGARTELAGSTHGPSGDTQVVTPLPPLPSGPVSLRWRLVGPDGHPVAGRVDVTIATAPVTAPSTTAAPAAVAPTTTAASPVPVTTAATDSGAQRDAGDGSFSTPSGIRWTLRFISYVAIIAIVGILLVSATVWSGAAAQPIVRRVLEQSLVATSVLGLVQLLIVASDISGDAPWQAFGSIDAATATYAGMAMALRIALALALWTVMFRYRIVQRDVYWTAVSIPAIGLLGTWAFAGHSRSMRWPAVGVVTDVAHHAAAATWIAGLAIIAWIVIPRLGPETRSPALHKFSRVAAASVAVLVGTRNIQTLRLTGAPARLVDGNHGRYLLIKIVALAIMLALANANRRRLDHQLRAGSGHEPDHVARLRQTVLAEFAIGIAIIAITAAMVVSPPATSDAETAHHATKSAIYYTM
jgi:copper transport protein